MEAQKASKPIEIAAIKSTHLFSFRHGNVQIKVTREDERIVGEVSSHCMVLASKVWESLIFDPLTGSVNQTQKSQHFEKQGPTDKNEKQGTSSRPVKEVDFRDDDGGALLLLLRIAHRQYNDIPTTLACKTLLDVAVLCDRYNCVELVQPWLSEWLSDEEKSSKETGHEN